MSNNKIWAGVIGAAVVAGGAALYLMAQEEHIDQEKCLEVMKELELEYASLYLHWYSMLKTKEKEVGKGKMAADVMEAARDQIEKLTDNIDNEVCEAHNLSPSFFYNFVEKEGNTAAIKEIRTRIESNFNKLTSIQQPTFKFDYPKELNKKVYVKFIKASYEKFRYDIYHHCQKVFRQTGQSKLDDDQFNEALKQCSLPEIKITVYKTMKLPEIKGEKPTRTALKAYLMMMEGDEAWHKEILHIQKEHKQMLFSIPEGKKLDHMHEDPLEVLKRLIEMNGGLEQFMAEPAASADKGGTQDNAAVAEDAAKPKEDKSDPAKKSFGAFSFLGNENDQKKLVDEFLNRNKNQPDEAKEDSKQEISESTEVINKSEVDRLGQENAEESMVEEIQDAAEPALDAQSEPVDAAEPEAEAPAEPEVQEEQKDEPQVQDDAPREPEADQNPADDAEKPSEDNNDDNSEQKDQPEGEGEQKS